MNALSLSGVKAKKGNESDVILTKVGIPEWLKGSNGGLATRGINGSSLRHPRACPEDLRQPDDAMRHQKDLMDV